MAAERWMFTYAEAMANCSGVIQCIFYDRFLERWRSILFSLCKSVHQCSTERHLGKASPERSTSLQKCFLPILAVKAQQLYKNFVGKLWSFQLIELIWPFTNNFSCLCLKFIGGLALWFNNPSHGLSYQHSVSVLAILLLIQFPAGKAVENVKLLIHVRKPSGVPA